MELFLIISALVIVSVVSYRYGRKNMLNDIEVLEIPYVFSVKTENDIHYAYTLIGEEFLGQSKDFKELVTNVHNKYPFFEHYVGIGSNPGELEIESI